MYTLGYTQPINMQYAPCAVEDSDAAAGTGMPSESCHEGARDEGTWTQVHGRGFCATGSRHAPTHLLFFNVHTVTQRHTLIAALTLTVTLRLPLNNYNTHVPTALDPGPEWQDGPWVHLLT